MANGQRLTAFLLAQQAKAEARRQARVADAAQAAIQRRNFKRAILTQLEAAIPDEVREYAKANVDFEPFMIVLNIPGCYPIWLTVEDTGGMFATVYPPLNPSLPVTAVPALPFPLRNADDLADAIAAAVIDSQPAPGR